MGGVGVEERIRRCPKCGYERQAVEKVAQGECPRCGVIYAKYRQAPTTPAHHRLDQCPDAEATTRRKQAWYRWAKVSLPVLALVAILAFWGLRSVSSPEEPTRGEPAAVTLAAFDYPLAGTWSGRLQEEYPAQGSLPPYTADYEASVTIGGDGRIQEVRWTDSHSPLYKVTILWREGAVTAVAEERRSGTGEPMQEYLRVQRQGDRLDLTYNRPLALDLALSLPEAFAQKGAQPQTNPRQQISESALDVTLPVRLLGEDTWNVPPTQIERIVLKQSMVPLKHKDAQAKLRDGGEEYSECLLPSIGIFGGGSAGPYFDLTLAKVTVIKMLPGAQGSPGPDMQLRLEPSSEIGLKARPFEREVLMSFRKNGAAELAIRGRQLQPSGKALLFSLAKSA